MSDEKILSEKQVRDLLSDVITQENVIDPVYEISSGLVKGDGYTSCITKVDIKGQNKELALIIKCAPKDPNIRKKICSRNFFLSEIKFYREIVPAMTSFQDERRVQNPFRAVAKCYKTVSSEFEETLVFENLKVAGFQTVDRQKQMDDAHVRLVLKEYGKYHAVSFAMKDQDFDRFDGLSKNLINALNSHSFDADFYDVFYAGCDKLISVFDQTTEKGICTALSNFKQNMMAFIKSLDKYSGKYGIFAQGDCWCNNMMFKYQDTTSMTPTDLRLFDFQLLALTTPVVDLSYFFYVTASQEMLDNLDHYLKIYHDSLRQHMSDLGSDVDRHFPYSALKEEWGTYSKYGLLIASSVFRVMLRADDEIVDYTDTLHLEGGMKDTFMTTSKNEGVINERYRRLALHMYERKLI